MARDDEARRLRLGKFTVYDDPMPTLGAEAQAEVERLIKLWGEKLDLSIANAIAPGGTVSMWSTTFTEKDLYDLIDKHAPNVRIKASEYMSPKQLVFMDTEAGRVFDVPGRREPRYWLVGRAEDLAKAGLEEGDIWLSTEDIERLQRREHGNGEGAS